MGCLLGRPQAQNRAPWKYFLFKLFAVCFKMSAWETSCKLFNPPNNFCCLESFKTKYWQFIKKGHLHRPSAKLLLFRQTEPQESKGAATTCGMPGCSTSCPIFSPFPPFRHRCVSRHEGSSFLLLFFPFSPPPTVLELFCEYILAGGGGREGGSFAADDDDDAHCENGMGVRGKGGSRLWGGKGFPDFVEVFEEIKQVRLRCYY